VLVLSSSVVRQATRMAEIIEVVEKAYVEYSAGRAKVPLRTQIAVEDVGTSLFMPGYVPGLKSVALKAVSVFPGNPPAGLPTIHAVVALIDAENGRPLCVMEGGCLTALRTGAGSGVATRYLAVRDASTLGVIGAGVQARTQLEAICEVRPIERAKVYDIDNEASRRLVEELGPAYEAKGIDLTAVGTAEDAVRGADVVVTATTSKTPVLSGGALEPHAHVNAIGAFTPEMQELDEDTVAAASKIVVDTKEGVLEEAGDIRVPLESGAIAEDDLHAEIGEVAAGWRPGREHGDGVTVFKAVGLAVLDVAAARLVYDRAVEKGLGVEIDIEA